MKYRGADGWLYDDSVDKPCNYGDIEEQPPEPAPASKPTPKKKGNPEGCVVALLILLVPAPVLAGLGSIVFEGAGGFVLGGGLGVMMTLMMVLWAIHVANKERRVRDGRTRKS